MALFLAIIGVYGAMSHLVSGRRREVGIRIALGAERGAVAGIFLRRGFTLGFWGISIGVFGAAALARLMSSLLFGVTPFDPMAYAGAALVLLFAALSAAFLPARRAANVDPATTLRAD
jgi:ABC-type antimicrobial peptide transport system permease subunit